MHNLSRDSGAKGRCKFKTLYMDFEENVVLQDDDSLEDVDVLEDDDDEDDDEGDDAVDDAVDEEVDEEV